MKIQRKTLSREAIDAIDSALQPYCEDRLSRISVIDSIKKITSPSAYSLNAFAIA
jgi:hypothetical protein